MIKLHTTLGVIGLELDAARAPATVANFLQYARDGFYDGTLFHRVIPNFMIQCGGLEAGMTQKTTRSAIQNEADNGLKNQVGALAMARRSASVSLPCSSMAFRTAARRSSSSRR